LAVRSSKPAMALYSTGLISGALPQPLSRPGRQWFEDFLAVPGVSVAELDRIEAIRMSSWVSSMPLMLLRQVFSNGLAQPATYASQPAACPFLGACALSAAPCDIDVLCPNSNCGSRPSFPSSPFAILSTRHRQLRSLSLNYLSVRFCSAPGLVIRSALQIPKT